MILQLILWGFIQVLSLSISLHVLLFCRFENDNYEKVPYFVFGDFNFRLDTHALVKVGIPLGGICIL